MEGHRKLLKQIQYKEKKSTYILSLFSDAIMNGKLKDKLNVKFKNLWQLEDLELNDLGSMFYEIITNFYLTKKRWKF